jgi:hypothetical protein
MAKSQKEMHLMQKFLGKVGRMRKHQKAFFTHKMDYDKKQAMRYERLVDEYIRLLLKEGYTPIFDEDRQTTFF